MIDPRGWEVLENVKNPICPLISALTVKQANKYIECVKEKCMWWSKCKGLEERPHGKWIPCSERLPDKAEARYWVCTDGGYQCQCRWTNDIFGLGKGNTWAWKIFDIPQYEKVIAWMPMPEPYKEEGEAE